MNKTENSNRNNFPKESLNQAVQGKDFLQSRSWADFQKEFGNIVYNISERDFDLNIIEYKLPIVGKYLYVPRRDFSSKEELRSVVELAKDKNIGWIRLDISNKRVHELIHELGLGVKKAPHDMQPRQVFKIDISKDENGLMSEMKPKTRYNIRLAKKKGVKIKKGKKYIDDFLRLVKLTSERQGIVSHPDNYYRKMIEIPEVELYAAEHEEKIIAANIVSFYRETATYLHGASDNDYRNVMAPFLLQWQTILDAREKNCKFYDFGGVKTDSNDNSWAGITRFKLGFSKNTKQLDLMGSYDIVISPLRYSMYRFLQRLNLFFKRR